MEKDFSHNGLGILIDTTRCDVREQANGAYEVELEHPLLSRFDKYFENGYQIKAKPNDQEEYHIFEIKQTYKDTINNNILIYGQSRTYKLGNRQVQHVEVDKKSGSSAMQLITAGMDSPSDIVLHSDITTVSSTTFEARNVLNCIAGEQGSLLQYWGGEIKREPFKLSLLRRRGRDNVGTVRYGKDLDGLKIKFDWQSIVTRCLPYADLQDGEDGQTKRIYGKAVDSELISKYPDIYSKHIQFTEDQGVKDLASLNRIAANYFTSINRGADKPKINIELEILKLTDSEEAKEFYRLRNYGLFDTFSVYHSLYDIHLESKITEVVYDSLTQKNKKIIAGDTQIAFYKQQDNEFQNVLKSLAKKDYMSQFVDYITDLINGVEGGAVLQYPKNKPHTTYYMDTESRETAKDVIAINNQGIGFSRTGWRGPFKNGWSIDGILNADFILAGVLRAIEIIGVDIFGSTITGAEIIGSVIKSIGPHGTQILVNGSGYSFEDVATGETISKLSDGQGILTLERFRSNGGFNDLLSFSDNLALLMHQKLFEINAPITRLQKLEAGSGIFEGRVDIDELYVRGIKIDKNGGGSGGGNGGDIGNREEYARNMITAEFGVDYNKMYASWVNFGRIKAWGINNRAAFDELNAILRQNGVSPVFFWAYEGGEGYHPDLSFLNHFYTNGTSYQEECRRTAVWVKATSNTNGNLAWYDAQYPYYTSPPDKQAIGNAYMETTTNGMIARVMLQGTAAATWAMFDPNGLKKEYNQVQDYSDPFAHQISLIKSWQVELKYIRPMARYQVTSEFGWREAPIGGGQEFHNAIDLATAGGGEPILASAAGEIVQAGNQYYDWYGNYVVIRHADGLYTGYAHLSSITVNQGQQVSQGQVLGYEGATGPVTGPHLHFQFMRKFWPEGNGDFINPREYINF